MKKPQVSEARPGAPARKKPRILRSALRGIAEGYGKGHAAWRRQGESIPRTRGVDVGLGCLADADDRVRAEQIVEAELHFGLIEVRAVADGVVDVEVGDVEGVDRDRLVDGSGRSLHVVPEWTDALVEHADVEVLLLVSEAERFRVRRSVGNQLLIVDVGRAVD